MSQGTVQRYRGRAVPGRQAVTRDLRWVEVYRTLGIAGVVLAHTAELSYTAKTAQSWVSILFSALLRFVVPGFFVVSGFLLRRGYKSLGGRFERKAFWKRALGVLVIPFLAWNVIYMLMYYFLQDQPILTWNTLFQLTTGYMQMYFVFVLIQFFFIYSLLQRRLCRRNLNYFLIASAVGSFLFYLSSEVTLRLSGPDKSFFEWHYGKIFIAWGLFFFWGMWLCDHFEVFERMSRRLVPLGLATALAFGVYFLELLREAHVYGYDARQYFLLAGLPFQFVAASFVLVLLYRLDRPGKPPGYIVDSGRDTYGIYLSHLLVLSCLLALWGRVGMPDIFWAKVVLVAPLTWIICQLAVRACRHPGLRYVNRVLFGGRT